MLKNIVTPALLSLVLAGTAFAAQPSKDTQLAAAAGVEAGVYTAAELQNIIDARQDNDLDRLSFFLNFENRKEGSVVADGQLAASAGVEGGSYTANEVQAIITAREEGDDAALAYYTSLTNRTPAAPAEAVSEGEAQLAALLGVDPTKYTLAELSMMKYKADN
jgi:hypothetical protein